MPPVHRAQATAGLFAARLGQGPIAVRDALEAGLTRDQLRTAVRRGLLVSPRHGLLALAPPAGAASADPAPTRDLDDFRHQLATALRAVGPGSVVTDDAAALLHGLARPTAAPPSEICFASDRAGFVTDGIRVRKTPIPVADRTEIDGIPVTSLTRTAIDLARGRSLPAALIPLDSCARRLVADATGTRNNALRRAVRDPHRREQARTELHRALLSCFGWAGTVVVRQAIDLVEPASESPSESRSRGWFLEAGIRSLECGVPITTSSTTYWADFCSVDHRVIGEADGWSKYGVDPDEHRRAVADERARQADLEGLGWRVVRWTSTEPRRAVVTRMANALSR